DREARPRLRAPFAPASAASTEERSPSDPPPGPSSTHPPWLVTSHRAPSSPAPAGLASGSSPGPPLWPRSVPGLTPPREAHKSHAKMRTYHLLSTDAYGLPCLLLPSAPQCASLTLWQPDLLRISA